MLDSYYQASNSHYLMSQFKKNVPNCQSLGEEVNLFSFTHCDRAKKRYFCTQKKQWACKRESTNRIPIIFRLTNFTRHFSLLLGVAIGITKTANGTIHVDVFQHYFKNVLLMKIQQNHKFSYVFLGVKKIAQQNNFLVYVLGVKKII